MIVIVDRIYPFNHSFIENVYLSKQFKNNNIKLLCRLKSVHPNCDNIVGIKCRNNFIYGIKIFLYLRRNKRKKVIIIRNLWHIIVFAKLLNYKKIFFQWSHPMEETKLLNSNIFKLFMLNYIILIRNKIINLSNGVFFVSNSMLNNYKNFINVKKTVATLGYNKKELLYNRKKLNNHFCYIGTVNKQRAIDRILPFLSSFCKKYKIYINFYITSSNNKNLNEFINKSLALDNQYFIFHKTIKRDLLLEEISNYRFGLIYFDDSKEVFNNNFPIKLIDYLCAGLIVYSTPQPNVNLFEQNGFSVFTSNNSKPSEYCKQLEELFIQDPKFNINLEYFKTYNYEIIQTNLLSFIYD